MSDELPNAHLLTPCETNYMTQKDLAASELAPARLLEVLRQYWKERIDRKKTASQGFAKNGEYFIAARLWTEAEATELCLKDLENGKHL